MDDGSAHMISPEPKGIMLISIEESYWLLEGLEFLNSMLTGVTEFPRPVRCIVFEDSFSMNLFLGTTPAALELWGINPEIVERLRREKDLLEIPFAEHSPGNGAEGQ